MLDILIVTLFQAAAGEAQAPPPPPQPAAVDGGPDVVVPSPPVDEEDVLHCRRERVIGSRLSRQVCTSTSEDERIERDTRETMDKFQQTNPGPPIG